MPTPVRAKARFNQIRKRGKGLKTNEVYLGLNVRLGDAFFKNGTPTNAELVRLLDAEAKFWRNRNSPGVPFMAEFFAFLRDWQAVRIEAGANRSDPSSREFILASGACGSCGPDRMKWLDGQNGTTACNACVSPNPAPGDREGAAEARTNRMRARQGRPTRTKLPQ